MHWNQIVTGDCLQVMATLPRASVDLIFADPPFNIGYSYDAYNDRRSRKDYLRWTSSWLKAAKRLLAPTGAFFVAIGDEFVAEHKVRLDDLGLTLRNWIVWHYTFGVSCQNKFSRSHTHILYYTADPKQFTFNADEIRIPSARQTTYADRRANPLGKVPDNTWVLRPQEDESFFQAGGDTWFASRICGTFREREKSGEATAHPCQMPEAILERIIKVASNPAEVVLDPFAGSGTTLAVAAKLDRQWFGIEMSENYAETARNRVRSAERVEVQSAE